MGKNGGFHAAGRDFQTLFEVGVVGTLTDGQLMERFVTRREGAVFEAIVDRHGPMVWGVCRRVLQDHHDAEDAFQATFLVLARRAGSVKPGEKVGNWLHGVACRTAMKARANRARRRFREVPTPDMPEPTTPHRVQDDLAERLDRELSRLPEKYRIPIVLCDLEGRSHKEAASQLGWPIGTVSGRLSRGRVLLARRLSRRGATFSAGALSMRLAQDAAGVPIGLVSCTARAASLFEVGRKVTAMAVLAKIAALAEGGLGLMLISKTKIVTVALLALTGVGIAGTAYFKTAFNGPALAQVQTVAKPALNLSKEQREAERQAELIRRKAEAEREAIRRQIVDPNQHLADLVRKKAEAELQSAQTKVFIAKRQLEKAEGELKGAQVEFRRAMEEAKALEEVREE